MEKKIKATKKVSAMKTTIKKTTAKKTGTKKAKAAKSNMKNVSAKRADARNGSAAKASAAIANKTPASKKAKDVASKRTTVLRENWKPSNLLYPVPAVIVTCGDGKGRDNALTVAWTGTISSDPVMLSISIRKERYSYPIIKKTKEFVVNLTTDSLAYATDYCGVKSGRNVDKFKELSLTKSKSKNVKAPGIAESPVCLECKVKDIIELGSHDMFIAEVVGVSVDSSLIDDKGRFDLGKAHLVSYVHGEYFSLGESLGKFGFSVRKPVKKITTKKNTGKKSSAATTSEKKVTVKKSSDALPVKKKK